MKQRYAPHFIPQALDWQISSTSYTRCNHQSRSLSNSSKLSVHSSLRVARFIFFSRMILCRTLLLELSCEKSKDRLPVCLLELLSFPTSPVCLVPIFLLVFLSLFCLLLLLLICVFLVIHGVWCDQSIRVLISFIL